MQEEEEGSPIEQNEEFVCPPAAELLKMEARTLLHASSHHVGKGGCSTDRELSNCCRPGLDPHAVGPACCARAFSSPVTRRRALRGRPHILRNGRTTHKEIPEGDTPEELELAATMKEARPLLKSSGNECMFR